MPEIRRIELGGLEMQHPVVLRNKVQVAPGAGDSRKFRDNALGIGNRVQYVAAHGEVETAVGGS